MTNFSVDKLAGMAKTFFDSEKDCDKVFLTRDGNIFKSDQESYAHEHLRVVGGDMQTFERKDIDSVISKIEEKAKIENFKGSSSETEGILADARKQAKNILSDAVKQAKAEADDLIKAAKAEAEKQAKTIIADAKKKAKTEADGLVKVAKAEADDLVKAAKAEADDLVKAAKTKK